MNTPSALRWRPATTLILIAGLVTLLVYSVATYAIANFRPTTELRLGSGVYGLWVADEETERIQGLSGVEELPRNGGLLMIFDEDRTHGIWMRDMKIPLDIVWINKNKTVVYIVKNASPKLSTDIVFTPNSDARYVVELPAGAVQEAGIKTGMVADFNENATGEWW